MMCLTVFSFCHRIPEKNNLKEARFIWAYSFSPWLADSTAFKPTAKQKHHGGREWRREAAQLMAARRERGREKKREEKERETENPGTRYKEGPQ
jgi:hypothetical protein